MTAKRFARPAELNLGEDVMSKTWFQLSFVVCLVATLSSMSLAQRGGRGGQAGGFGGFGGRGGDTNGFVLRSDVQKELGLSEDEVEDLREIVEDAQQEARDSRGGGNRNFRDMSEEEREEMMTEMREKSAALAKRNRKSITAKLSSKQKKRYTELEVQYLIQPVSYTHLTLPTTPYV